MTEDGRVPPDRFLFHNVKSPLFRTVHADGIFGGLTPTGNIHISFWNQRSPIPLLMEYDLSPEGTIGNEIIESRIGKSGMVREIDVGVSMNLDVAVSLRKWLDEKISVLEEAVKKQREKS